MNFLSSSSELITSASGISPINNGGFTGGGGNGGFTGGGGNGGFTCGGGNGGFTCGGGNGGVTVGFLIVKLVDPGGGTGGGTEGGTEGGIRGGIRGGPEGVTTVGFGGNTGTPLAIFTGGPV